MENINTLKLEQFLQLESKHQFYINTLREHLEKYHDHIEKPHKHSFTVVVFFTKGKGTHDIDFRRYEVNPGSLFILYPGQIHSWELSPDTDGYIFFHESFLFDERHAISTILQRFRIQQLFLPALQMPFEKDNHFHQLWAYLLQEYQNELFAKNIYLSSLLSQIYIEILRPLLLKDNENDKSLKTYQLWFQQFETLVENHFKERLSVSDYASQMHITPKHLNRIAQKVVKKSASQIILDRVLLEAKRMLVNSPKNLTEIAYELGFEDYAYFSNVFKKNTGVTPSQFLQEII